MTEPTEQESPLLGCRGRDENQDYIPSQEQFITPCGPSEQVDGCPFS